MADVILAARYARIREAGGIACPAGLIAVAVEFEGRRQGLAGERANRARRSSRQNPWHIKHIKHMKSATMLERLNQEIKRRPHGVRIFPGGERCLRRRRALAGTTNDTWREAICDLTMEHLRAPKQDALPALAAGRVRITSCHGYG
ncbi:MAG: transposase [Methylocella sp.]